MPKVLSTESLAWRSMTVAMGRGWSLLSNTLPLRAAALFCARAALVKDRTNKKVKIKDLINM